MLSVIIHGVKMTVQMINSFKKNLPSYSIKDEEIINVLKRSEGDKLSGFPEGDVIQMVLEKEMKRLKMEVKEFSEGIIEIVQTSLKNCLEMHFCRYPEMIEKIEEFLNVFTEKVINSILFINNIMILCFFF